MTDKEKKEIERLRAEHAEMQKLLEQIAEQQFHAVAVSGLQKKICDLLDKIDA